MSELWDSCSKILREQVSASTWMAYFDTLDATGVEDDCLVLTTPNSQARDKLERNYRALIEGAIEDVVGEPLSVTLLLRSPEQARDSNGVAFPP
ncbi:MAG TPA: DnaA N-terminal domain-containing protein, partial [Acidimicrobiales bacterium]|nr:DnaA N-terminal domain-containing protein [Acidimicrobiales bacterium]